MVVDKTDFACQDIEVIDNLIEEYLVSLKEVYPSLMSKVKSHLSSHVVSIVFKLTSSNFINVHFIDKISGHQQKYFI